MVQHCTSRSDTLGHWDTANLRRRVCHALDIAEKACKQLAADGYTDPEEPANNVLPEKILAETAFLLVAVSSVTQSRAITARINQLAQMLAPEARSKRMLLGMALRPALALDYAQAHICLAKLGYPDPLFDTLLRQTMESLTGHERPPHRMLEQEWIARTWNYARPRNSGSTLTAARNSALALPMDLLHGTREDIYAFTHALMYVRNFNHRPHALPRPQDEILAEAEGALARCLDEEDYDLAGEVLLAWPLTAANWSSMAAFGFRVLARVEDKVGFLPAPNTRLERLQRLAGDQRSRYLLATAYHTTYVMGLLCATSLQRGRKPPRNIPLTPCSPGSAAAILPFLHDANRKHWQDEFDMLPPVAQDSLAKLLFTIGLRRNAAKGRFDALRELLQAGYSLGLTDTPAASQSAEILDRLSTVSSIVQHRQETRSASGQLTSCQPLPASL